MKSIKVNFVVYVGQGNGKVRKTKDINVFKTKGFQP